MPEAVAASSPATRSADAPLLAVRGLQAWYGESHVLHGVDFDVAAGEVVTLLGRNGAGKTTTLKSIMGVVPRREGSITFEGTVLIGRRILHAVTSCGNMTGSGRWSVSVKSKTL